MEFASIFAQLGSIDDTGRQISILIIALLIIAFLLAASTVWYWRHTDPKRRDLNARSAEVPVRQVRPEPVILAEPEAVAASYAADEGVTVDEWLSLTGPEALRQN